MEAKAKNGHIKEANSLFSEIFEEMKMKRFTTKQETMQCDLYSKIVKIHNEKHSYDEAVLWTLKTFDFLDAFTTTKLQIEVCANAAVAFVRKNEFTKGGILAERAIDLAKKDFGSKSSMYADALVAYSEYLGKTDQHQKSNENLQTALKIVERQEGKESVAYARILSDLTYNNYAIQYGSRNSDYEEATAQARQAMKILTKKLGKNNFLLAAPKRTLALLIK